MFCAPGSWASAVIKNCMTRPDRALFLQRIAGFGAHIQKKPGPHGPGFTYRRGQRELRRSLKTAQLRIDGAISGNPLLR